MAKKKEAVPALERQVEEIRVGSWEYPDPHRTAFRRGYDQSGRLIEINRDPTKNYGTVHIDGELRYQGHPNPVMWLEKMRGCHSFVVIES